MPNAKTPAMSLGKMPLLGVLFAVTAALSLALAPSLLKQSYFAGTGVLFAILMRGVISCVIIYIFIKITRRRLDIRKIPKKAFMMISLSLTVTSLGYMGAVAFISPNLAVMVVYLFPMLVLAAVAVIQRRRPSLPVICAYVTAFCALGLVVGVNFASVDIRGILLALLAAGGSAMVFFISHTADNKAAPDEMLFAASGVMSAVMVVLIVIFDGLTMPQSLSGWGLLIAASILALAGYAFVMASVLYLRPDLSSLVMNIEPLTAGGFAYLLLGDVLMPVQIVGVFVVIAAISVGGWLAHREHMEPENL